MTAVKIEDYKAKKFTKAVLQDMLVKRGFEEADVIELELEELRQQLMADDVESKNVGGPTVDDTDEKTPGEGGVEDPDKENDDKDEDTPAEPTKAGDLVDIVKGDEYVRTYSKAEHGKEFLAMANEFVNKDPKREIVKASAIKGLKLQYRLMQKKAGEGQGTWKWVTVKFEKGDFRREALKAKGELSGDTKYTLTVLK